MNTPEYIHDWQRRAAELDRRSRARQAALGVMARLAIAALLLLCSYAFGRVHQAAIDSQELEAAYGYGS